MDIKIRRLIYSFFILIFIIAAPIVLLYTAGYRYNFQKHKTEQVGVLFINTLPKETQIYINDNLADNNRPLRLANLRPNYYQVKVAKDGYYSWQKTLEVKSQASTLAFDIVLFKNQSSTIIREKNATTFSLSPNSESIALADSEGVWFKNLSEENEKLIWSTDGDKIESLIWNNDSKHLLIKKSEQFFVLNINEKAPVSINSFQPNLEQVIWGGNTTLYGLVNKKVLEISFKDKRAQTLSGGVDSFSFLDNNLYLTKNQLEKTAVYKYNSLNIFNNKLNTLANLPTANYQFQQIKNNWLSLTDGQKIYLIDLANANQNILTLNGSSSYWGEGSKNNYLYYSDKSELWIFDPEVKNSYMINRYENNINRLSPLYNIPYYALQQGQDILLSELDDRDQRQKITVFQGHEVKDLQVDSSGKNIYFLDKLNSSYKLFKLVIQ